MTCSVCRIAGLGFALLVIAFVTNNLRLQLQDQERNVRLKKLIARLRSGNNRGGDTLHVTLADLRAADEV